ncbi:hypothetical protein F130042H8_10250 [Enterocloster alcoholdehydrogenati]|uniref:Uncharacterized protein n=1 Tax=Enterocloster alcoholdehydrogenati TaxID=2547410 RepID=A0ABQ0AVB1_9FIRM
MWLGSSICGFEGMCETRITWKGGLFLFRRFREKTADFIWWDPNFLLEETAVLMYN